jgi:hypothetical protein
MEPKQTTAHAEQMAEDTVLTALAPGRLFAIEIKPTTKQSPEEIKAAIERCLNTGWIQMGPADSCDPRTYLTEEGQREFASRQAAETRRNEEARRKQHR